MVRFLLVKSHEIYEILKSVKSLEISEIKVNSTDFEIRTPFWGVGDPSVFVKISCLAEEAV